MQKPFELIEKQVQEGQPDCGVLVDEMSIRKDTKWDPKHMKFVGNVDYGYIKGEKVNTIATNALVIMVSGLKKPWYTPIAYFLTNSLNAMVLCQIIKESIKMLSETGASVHAIVFDGAPNNVGMAKKLECQIDKLDGSFPHPVLFGEKIHVVFDVCHMIKLARNAFSDRSVFVTPNGEKISWEYIIALYKTQQTDVLHLGNKLKSKHVKWQNHKMKVSVAAQTFSHSVSAAITFLRKLRLKEFKDSKATSEFLMMMNNLFDMLNSKSKFGKHTKKPITLANYLDIEASVETYIDFLLSLKDTSGIPLIKGPRQCFVTGFYISARSILAISKKLLQRETLPFEYVLTYRFSQDTIEMFVSKIRGRLGWNNNPTALQLKYALRSLLLKNKVEAPATANCVATSDAKVQETSQIDTSVSRLLLSANLWRADVLYYISGYIVHQILKSIDCPECVEALFDNSEVDHSYQKSTSLFSCKKYGNLIMPSQSVYSVVSTVDKLARKELCTWSTMSQHEVLKIRMSVLQETRSRTFSSLQQHSIENHILDTHLRDDHVTLIIKLIVDKYLNLFFHQFGRVYTERIINRNKPSKRNKLTRNVLFSNE